MAHSVIVRGISDDNPYGRSNVPATWLSGILHDLDLGKLRVFNPFEVAGQYHIGCPRRYYLAVRVFFDVVSDVDMKNAIEAGHTAEIVYAEKGTVNTRTGRRLKYDKSITIHADTHAAEKMSHATTRRIETHTQKKAAGAVVAAKKGNMFSALTLDDDVDVADVADAYIFCGEKNDWPVPISTTAASHAHP